MVKLALATLLLVSSLRALAFAPGPPPSTGAPDSTFGNGGVQYTNFSSATQNGMNGVKGMALQPDSKIVVVGTGSAPFIGAVPVVARFNPNGSLDTDFGSNGLAVVGRAVLIEGNAVALQADGKIVIAGRTATAMGVARLNANGTPDTTFGSQGIVTTQVGAASVANAIAIQSDGRIVAAGSGNPGANQDFAAVRYMANGTLDLTFSADGIATMAIGTGNDVAFAVAIQADGGIVLGGSAASASSDFAIARFNSNGTPDATFNGTGFAVLDFSGGDDSVRALRFTADGKIVAAGSATLLGQEDFALARYNLNGTPDATFNGIGRTSASLPFSTANALVVLADGRIVLAGASSRRTSLQAFTSFIAIVQFTAAGSLDTTFASGTGKFSSTIGAPAGLGAVAVQPDGKIVAAGRSRSGLDYLVMRIDAAANADTTFGTAGFASAAVATQSDEAYALALQADGRIIAAGYSTAHGPPANPLVIARYTPAGLLDDGFGSFGRVIDASRLTSAYAAGVVVQPDGRIFVAGTHQTPGFNTGDPGTRVLFVARYASDGALSDRASTDLDGHTLVHGLRLQPDGKIVAVGASFFPGSLGSSSGPRRFALARFNIDLTLDATFNGTGKVVSQVGAGDAEANAIALQSDGRLVAVGYVRQASSRDFAIARYSAAGVLEGRVFTTDVGTGSDDNALAVEVQPDGKILVGGSSGGNIALLRYSSPGVLDTSFATEGKFIFPGAAITSLALQGDGKILALTRDFQVWRLTMAGVPDTTFGAGGRVALGMGANSAANALVVQNDGRIVVGGTADAGLGPDFAIARIDPAASPTFVPSAASYDFGGQSMRTTHPSSNVSIANVGPMPVTVLSATASAAFGVASNDCALVAGSGIPCQVGVTFTPTSQGAIKGTLLIEYLPRPGAIAITLHGSGERSLATHYYRSILRRAPDGPGKVFWEAEAARVAALGANVNEVWYAMAMSFYFGAEYAILNRNNAGFLTDLYNTFFNRAPDQAGFDFWTSQMAGGMPREGVLANFMFSTEFAYFTQAIFGNTAARGEVNVVMDFYRGLLSRLPDSGGFNFYVGQFRTAQCQGGGQVLTQVENISSGYANSVEYSNRGRTNLQYMADLYNAFLRRGPDLGGIQFYANQLTTGAKTREQVRQDFKVSPEFNLRVNAILGESCIR